MIRTRAKALNGTGWIAVFQGDYAKAKALLEEGLALYRELEDKDGVTSCLTTLGFAAVLGQRDLASLPALLEEALTLKPGLTDARVIANLFVFRGLVAASEGDLEQAISLHEEGLALHRGARNFQGVSICLINVGFAEMARGNHDRATALLRENLQLARGTNDKSAIQYSLVGLAGVAIGLGDPDRAARLWGAAEAVREAFGIHLTPLARARMNYEGLLVSTRARLGGAAFEGAWAEGKAMTHERAIEYALSKDEPVLAVPPSASEEMPSAQPKALTRREEEVALLIIRGLTNRRIASELSISERTSATHVGRILKKLNLTSREQVAERIAR